MVGWVATKFARDHFPQRAAPMTSTTSRPDNTHEQLRQQWLAAANDAFERMFATPEQNQLVTFSQRETRACLLGNELAAWLLERHVTGDAQVRPADEQPPCCPKCGQSAQRVKPPNGRLPRRQLTTQAGTVEWPREQWRCATCRVAFFPSGPAVATGHGGLQPEPAPEDRARRAPAGGSRRRKPGDRVRPGAAADVRAVVRRGTEEPAGTITDVRRTGVEPRIGYRDW